MIKVIKQIKFVKQPKVQKMRHLLVLKYHLRNMQTMVGVEGLEPPTSSL